MCARAAAFVMRLVTENRFFLPKLHYSDARPMLMRAQCFRKRISQVETLKFPEIAIIGVQRADAVLEKDCCNMGVGYEIATDRYLCGQAPVRVVQLGYRTHLGAPIGAETLRRAQARAATRRCTGAWLSADTTSESAKSGREPPGSSRKTRQSGGGNT